MPGPAELLGSVAGPRYQRIRSERPLWGRFALWRALRNRSRSDQRIESTHHLRSDSRKALGEPDLDDRLARYAEATGFPVQRLDDPRREIDIHPLLFLQMIRMFSLRHVMTADQCLAPICQITRCCGSSTLMAGIPIRYGSRHSSRASVKSIPCFLALARQQAFSCVEGTPMHPTETCGVW